VKTRLNERYVRRPWFADHADIGPQYSCTPDAATHPFDAGVVLVVHANLPGDVMLFAAVVLGELVEEGIAIVHLLNQQVSRGADLLHDVDVQLVQLQRFAAFLMAHKLAALKLASGQVRPQEGHHQHSEDAPFSVAWKVKLHVCDRTPMTRFSPRRKILGLTKVYCRADTQKRTTKECPSPLSARPQWRRLSNRNRARNKKNTDLLTNERPEKSRQWLMADFGNGIGSLLFFDSCAGSGSGRGGSKKCKMQE
jgi:hypothetical protein